MTFEQFDQEIRSRVNASTFPIEADIDEWSIEMSIKQSFKAGHSVSDAVKLIKLMDQRLDEDYAIGRAKGIHAKYETKK